MLSRVLSFVLLASVAYSASIDFCNQTCDDEKQELCASDGKTYVNACHFGVASCKAHEGNRIIYELHSGACSLQGVHSKLPACTQYCNEEVSPVCGSNHQIYSNRCEFKKEQCRWAAEGKQLQMVSSSDYHCPIPRAINCTQFSVDTSNLAIEKPGLTVITCPHVSHPTYICASNNRYYRDECTLCRHIEYIKSRQNGLQGINWVILHDGRCQRGISYNPFGVNFVG